jgi:DNA-binding IclR family transcriptional regulator
MARGPAAGGASPNGARYPVGSVERAARILLMLRPGVELRISDVAQRLGVSVSTAHRVLSTLEAEGLLAQNPTTRCYEPGPELLSVAEALTGHRSPWEFTRPFMSELSERAGETVNLVTLQGTHVAFVQSVEAQTPLRVSSRLGAVMPAHCTSGGKVLLSRLSDAELTDRYVAEPLRPMTEQSIRSLDELRTELGRVVADGYATNFGESEPDISGVAVLVAGAGGQECALAVSAPSSRLAAERVQELVEDLRKTARMIADAGSANR